MSALLKEHGHEVHAVVDETFNPNRNVQTVEEKRNLKKILSIKPDLVGFNVVTPRYQWCLKFAEIIKGNIDTTIMFGGSHPTMLPKECLSHDQVDVVCRGEGELPIVEYSLSQKHDIPNLWFKSGERNHMAPLIPNLDELPFPDKDLWNGVLSKSFFDTYQTVSSRGCLMNCSYCHHNALKKIYPKRGYFRRRSSKRLVEELIFGLLKYKYQRVLFMDDHFTENVKWLEDFSILYAKEIRKPYACLSNPMFLDEYRVKLLKNSGCHLLMMGIQVGNEALRRKILGRSETNKKLIEISTHCRKYRLPFSIDHLFGLPNGDSEMVMQESAILYNRMRPTNISSYRLYFLPRTDIISIAEKSGMLDEQFESKINRGVHQEVTIRAVRDPKYIVYSSLFAFLPLMPKKLVDMILRNRKLKNIFGKIPMPLFWFGKGLTNLRCGNGYVVRENLSNLSKDIPNRVKGYKGEFEIPYGG